MAGNVTATEWEGVREGSTTGVVVGTDGATTNKMPRVDDEARYDAVTGVTD